jgi:hypothetical protein
MATGKTTRRGMLEAGAPATPAYGVEPATDAVTPFRLRVPDSALRDLIRRLVR